MIQLDAMLGEDVRRYTRRMTELWAKVEDAEAAGEGDDALRAFVDGSSRDSVLALAQYRKAVLGAAIDAAKAEERRIKAQRERMSRHDAWLGKLIGEMLDALGEKKIAGALLTVSRTVGTPRAVAEPGCDVNMLPERFVRRPPLEPRLQEIGAALKADEPVPGFRLERKPGVRIQ